MGSRKHRKEKKRNHKRKVRSRSPHRKENRKEECRHESIPHNSERQNYDLREMSSYLENRQEMIKQMFSAVGEDFFAEKVPSILKDATREELSDVCFQELTRIPDYTAFKVLEGIPCDAKSVSFSQECSLTINVGSQPSQACFENSSTIHKEKQPKVDACHIEPEVVSNTDGTTEEESVSESLYPNSTDETSRSDQSACDADVSRISSDSSSDMPFEMASTAQRSSTTKKLAKIAPFHVISSGQDSDTSSDEEDALNGSDTLNDTSYEPEEVELEENLENSEGDDDSNVGEPIDVVTPGVSAPQGNRDRMGWTNEEIKRNIAEVLELEHRARAIRSMLANLDRYQA